MIIGYLDPWGHTPVAPNPAMLSGFGSSGKPFATPSLPLDTACNL